MTGVTETTMPSVMGDGGRGEGTGRRRLKRIKLPRTVAPKKLTPGNEVLHRKTKRVKIDRTIVIGSKLTDINQILNDARCNGDVTKMKWTSRKRRRKRCMPGYGDGNGRAVSNSNMAINRVWRER